LYNPETGGKVAENTVAAMGRRESGLIARLTHLKPRTREAIAFYLVISPWVIGFLAFTLGPMLYSVYLSMAKWDIIGSPRWVGLDNYKNAFLKDDLFWKSLKVTAIYSFGGVPLRLALSLALALLLNQAVKLRNFFRTLFYTPSVMSGVAVSLLWMWVFNPEFGIVNHVLAQFGIQGPRWIYDEHWALPSLIIMSLWGAGGAMIIFLAGLQGVPQALYDAAEVDGAGVWHKFWNVTFPMITPVVLFNLVMGIIGSFQVFTQAYVMTSGGPHYATYFLVLYIYQSAFEYLKMGYASTLAWLLFSIILVLTLFIFRSTPFWVFYEAEVEGGAQ
jgi:multiple sugar transport system permease protein